MLPRTLFSVVKNVQRLGSVTTKPVNSVLKLSPITSSTCQLSSFVTRCFNASTVPGRLNNCSSFIPNSWSLLRLLQPKPVTLDVVRPYYVSKKLKNIKFSRNSGKRKTMKMVLKKFYRLNWGCWIHAKCGRGKSHYRKSAKRLRRLQQHVMTNSTQSWLLDKMVTRYWRRPKYYVDDPYEPYHTREEFRHTRMKPWQPYM